MNTERLKTPETYITRTKQMPLAAHLLKRTEEFFGPDTAQLVIAGVQNTEAYKRWETVRVVRSRGIVGNPEIATGAEGYAVGLHLPSQDVLNLIASNMQKELDRETRIHPFNQSARTHLERILHGEKPYTFQPINEGHVLFITLINNLRSLPALMDDRGKAENQSFRNQTATLASHTPTMKLEFKEGAFAHTYFLPQTAEAKPVSAADPRGVPKKSQDGLWFAQRLGMLGHPILRTINETSILRAVLLSDHSYLPPRGTPKRDRMEDELVTDLIIQLDLEQRAPEAVKKYLGNT